MSKAQIQGVLAQADKEIARINKKLRPEAIAEKKAEILAWRRSEVEELLADGLLALEKERQQAAKADFERRRKRGPQEGEWPEVAGRERYIERRVDGLDVGALVGEYEHLSNVGDHLGAWLVQRHGLARLDAILQEPGTDRDSVAQAMGAREALAKAAWGSELKKHKAELSNIRKAETEIRKLAGAEQTWVDDARKRFKIKDHPAPQA